MKKLEKYLGNKTYMFPNGAMATPAVMEAKYPAIKVFAHIIETDEAGEVCYAVQNLSSLRSFYGIAPELSEADAILAIEEIINTPEEVIDEPSAEERIASALEYQNLMSMPDVQ